MRRLFLIAALALFIRLPFLGFVSGDMEFFLLPWYDYIEQNGRWAALGDEFTNYAPPYTYFLVLATYLGSVVGKVTAIKIVSIFFDLMLGGAVYALLKHLRDEKTALLGFGATVLLPTVVLNSAAWGQAESIYVTWLILAMWATFTKRSFWILFFCATAFAFKAQAIFLAPFILVWWYRNRLNWLWWGVAPLVILAWMLPALAFGRPLTQIATIYLRQAGYYTLPSSNAHNPYLALNRLAPEMMFESITVWGMIFTTAVLLTLIIKLFQSQQETNEISTEKWMITAGFFALLMPYTLPKMHDRYFFLADLLFVVLAFLNPKYWWMAIALQVSSLIAYTSFLTGLPLNLVQIGAIGLTTFVLGFVAYRVWSIWKLGKLLTMIVGIYLLMLVLLEIGRIRFPYDILFVSEGHYMTNILKFNAGQWLYSDPFLTNSHTYSPGLEMLGFALLKPLGLVLDIRAHRVIVTLIGLAGCFLAAKVTQNLNSKTEGSPLAPLIIAGLYILILFRSFTSDVTHPDNLHWLAIISAFTFTLQANRTGKTTPALIAITIAGFAVIGKQTGAGVFFGTALALLIGHRRTISQNALILTIGAIVFTSAMSLLFVPDYGKFYTFDLVSNHGIDLSKLLALRVWVTLPHIVFLILVSPFALWPLWQKDRGFALTWLLLGASGVAPALIAYVKQFGAWNNLTIIALWLFIIVVWWIQQNWSKPWAKLALTLFALSLIPVKLPPQPSYWTYFQAVDEKIAEDLASDATIMLTHSTMLLTRNGYDTVPLDRATAYGELRAGGQKELAGTISRLEAQAYDRLYLNVPTWYDDSFVNAVKDNYVLVETIPSPAFKGRYIFGYQQALLNDTLIFDRRE